MKKILMVLLTALLIGCFALAAAESGSLTDGWWLLHDEEITMKCFYHFNDDGTFYGYFFDGGVVQAGTYEIVEGVDYAADAGADGEYDTGDETMAVSDYAIACTTYDGQTFTLPVAGDQIVDAPMGGMSNHRTLNHAADYAYVGKNEEIPIAIRTFYADNRVGSSFTIYHDHSYVEYVSEMGDEGTWSTEDFTTFQLVSEWGGEAVLQVNGSEAAYTTVDGDVLVLSDVITAGDDEVVYTFAAEGAEVGLPMPVDVKLVCFGNGKAEILVYVAAVDAELTADQGTYTITDRINLHFSFEKAGEVDGVPDYNSATASSISINVPYKADTEVEFMGNAAQLQMDLSLTGTVSME